jgi:phosphohistidine phosphatase
VDLFLIRHAAAAEGALYGDDSDRPLTGEGRRSALQVGASLSKHGVKLDLIIASPLVRAVETAELIAVSVAYDGELQILPELSPEGTAGVIIERALRPHAGRVALVGHLPSMGNVLGTLLGRPAGISMSKMSVVRLGWPNDNVGRAAKLVWVMTPRRLEPVASLDAL